MAYFWWILDGIAVLYPLAAFCTPKNGFLGSKGENFEIFKILDPAHFWGSGGLIMLPQGLEDVCEQRGPPDNDFEYWTASVPRRGAELRAAKVFWRKTKNSRKGPVRSKMAQYGPNKAQYGPNKAQYDQNKTY